MNYTKRRDRPKYEMPPSRVKFLRHPFLWMAQKGKMMSHRTIWTYFLTLAMACLYWLLTQTNHPIHDAWHHTVRNSEDRHLYRAAAEVIGASFAVRIIGYDHYRAVRKGQTRFRRFVFKHFHIAQPGDGETLTLRQAFWCVFVWLFLVLLASGLLVFIVTKGFGVSLANHNLINYTLPSHPTLFQWMKNTFAEVVNSWPLKLIVFGSGLAGGWIIAGIADDFQVFFIQLLRRYGYTLGWLARKIFPTPFVDRYDETCAQAPEEIATFSTGSTIAIWTVLVFLAVFTVVGWFAVNGKLPHV